MHNIILKYKCIFKYIELLNTYTFLNDYKLSF